MTFDRRRLSYIEIILPVLMVVLIAIGLVAILIANAHPFTGEELTFEEITANLDFSSVKLQCMFSLVGVMVFAALWFVDYRLYAKLWPFVLGAGVLLLCLVIIMGNTRGGTKGWIYLNASGSMTLQPSEFVKLAMILVCAKFLSDRPLETFFDLLPALGCFVAILGVLLYQLDLGTTVVYVITFMGMLFVSGTKLKHIGLLAGIGIVCALIMWFFVMGPAQKSRITGFFNDEENFEQLERALEVINSGGMFGKGLFSAGAYSQLDYIPVLETDFIFVAIAETFGFCGCFFLLALYALFIARLWKLMRTTEDKYGKLIICGVMFMFMFHIFENIGMVLGVMPITGIPLPFISKGGTNLVTSMAAVGLVMSVRFYRPLPTYTGR